MQETDPTAQHDYNIWVVQDGQFCSKMAVACAFKGLGCAAWICLLDLVVKYPDMPSQVYEERPSYDLSPGSQSGLPGFNNSRILCFPKNKINMPGPAPSTSGLVQNNLPPPYPINRTSPGSSISKGKGKGCHFGNRKFFDYSI
ncbi:hypothetical protein K439DRAFT_1613983 [Ramaria rubella]|nr:hypothetical protein K439DRAFT_1613983 [Ramaria rubella]